MIKKIKTIIKLDLAAGKATGAPPVGPSLGQHGINIAMFCKEYNAQTIDKVGITIPVKITIYEDKSYTFVLKSPPTSKLLLQYLKLKKGSSKPNKEFIGTITLKDLSEIAKLKMIDLNTKDILKSILIVKGTAKNIGIKVI
jgi:large subunit ribosomal protein L11